MAERTVADLQKQLARAMAKRSEYDPIIETIEHDINTLRSQIEVAMLEQGMKSTLPVDGIACVLREDTRTTVVDPQAAMEWLRGRGELDKYMRLDSTSLNRDFKTRDVPGIRKEKRMTFVVNAKGGKNDQ